MKKTILLGLCACLTLAACNKKSSGPSINGTYTAKFNLNGTHYSLSSDVIFSYADTNIISSTVDNDTNSYPSFTLKFNYPAGMVSHSDVTGLAGNTYTFDVSSAIRPEISFYAASLDSWYSVPDAGHSITVNSVTDLGTDPIVDDLEIYKVTGTGSALMIQSSTATTAVLDSLEFDVALCRQK